MNILFDFFASACFYVLGLKVVWYSYLLHTFFQLYTSLSEISALLAQGRSWVTWSPNLFPMLLRSCCADRLSTTASGGGRQHPSCPEAEWDLNPGKTSPLGGVFS